MSAEPYSQTILLDANRLSSEEYSASNLAQTDTSVFTNRVAGGITLDIGDTVSIQSAHIAQRGAGGEVIEMKGKTLGKKTINYTKFTNSSFVGNFSSIQDSDFFIRYSPTGFAKQDAENIDEEVDMKDNEATIVVEFYKTTNGENCMTLPRNFGNASGGNASVTPYTKSNGAGLDTAAEYWEVQDGFPLGCNVCDYDLRRRLIFDITQRTDDDWSYEYNMRSFTGAEQVVGRKVRQDNSRFTIFKRKSMVYNGSEVSAEDLASSLQPKAGVRPDPAVADYVRFKKKVTLKTDAGYNTPSNIASQITDQLTEPEDTKTIIVSEGIEKTIIQEGKLNITTTSPSFKSFSSSCAKDFFNATLSNHMPINVTSGSSVQSGRSVAYSNAYDYIGFKRPDFVETGREAFAYHGNHLTEQISKTTKTESVIKTNITWSDEVLLKIKKFFDSQALYPELLDGGVDVTYPRTNYSTFNTTSASLSASFREVGRFLHVDIGYQSQGSLKGGIEPLGSDMYNTSFTSQGVNGSDKTSAPVFIYFNNNSSHLTSNDTVGDRDDNLAYGFARNYNGQIAFVTEPIGGIPISYFGEQGGNEIKANTKIGYDYHFNAFGNAAIIPSSGFHPLQYFGQQEFIGAQTIRNAYIGANNPVYKFNAVDGRFEFENLHTSEKVGNFYNAGDPAPTATIFGPPESAQAGQDCYKINKQLHYTTWSPSMFPYSKIVVEHNSSNLNQKTFVRVNPNLDIGRIYDSHGGITLEDMGYDEKNWSQGLWGLCGFEYGQFNASGADQKNRLIKFNNDSSNVNGMTTNADITSVDSQSYITNIYGANLYSQMLDSRLNYFASPVSLSGLSATTATNGGVSPASVILASSTRITARDLPRRLLRGYFLLKSDILDQANYFETSNPLQTMGIVGKYQGNDDFISYDGGGPTFTVTRKKTITSIQSQILDPEGALGQVGDNSGIIYRVDKQINTDLKFAENLFASMSQKK